MFEASDLLKKYLNEKPIDIRDIRVALMGYIDVDPEFQTDNFKKAIQYVLDRGIPKDKLFCEFDSQYEFLDDESKWKDTDYYSYARAYLRLNFCEKRIDHIEKVAKYKYPRRNLENTNFNGNADKKKRVKLKIKNIMVVVVIIVLVILGIAFLILNIKK